MKLHLIIEIKFSCVGADKGLVRIAINFVSWNNLGDNNRVSAASVPLEN